MRITPVTPYVKLKHEFKKQEQKAREERLKKNKYVKDDKAE